VSVFVLFITATFCVLLVYVGMCSVLLLIWLSCQYLPSNWLERLLCHVVRGSSPQSPDWRMFMIFLV